MAREIRLALVGYGTVGQGLIELLQEKKEQLRAEYDLAVHLVSVANARHGLIYREDGLDASALLALTAHGEPLTAYPAVRHWPTALEGLRQIQADVLAEVTSTNLRDGEPGLSHVRLALGRGMHVITANKGPGALAAPELLALAARQGVALRMEATVMAGTPVLSTIREGLAGARIVSIRGILNGTTNYILSAMSAGQSYAEALAAAQAAGYAEADPSADVEGYDALAKTLILAALAFRRPLRPEQVRRQGITTISPAQVRAAQESGRRIKLIASLRLPAPAGSACAPLLASVEPQALEMSDPLAGIDGVMNAISIESDTLPSVTVIGPGAGRRQTAQGLLADLIAVATAPQQR
jgi:homoserine dehydrogenase